LGPAPGPQHYNPKLDMSADGKYFVSKFHDTGARTFMHAAREGLITKSALISPGPGYYRMPSEFGHYEAAKK